MRDRIRSAALAVLAASEPGRRPAGFLGQIAGDPDCRSLTPKQLAWLEKLTLAAGLPPLVLDGGDCE